MSKKIHNENDNRPNTKKRNFSIETVKGLFWYDDVEHLKARIKHETRWIEKLAVKNDLDVIIKQAKLISQIVDELIRIIK